MSQCSLHSPAQVHIPFSPTSSRSPPFFCLSAVVHLPGTILTSYHAHTPKLNMKRDSQSVNNRDFFSFVGSLCTTLSSLSHPLFSLHLFFFFFATPVNTQSSSFLWTHALQTTHACAPHLLCNRKGCRIFLPDGDLTPLPFLCPMLPILLNNRCAQLSKKKKSTGGYQ